MPQYDQRHKIFVTIDLHKIILFVLYSMLSKSVHNLRNDTRAEIENTFDAFPCVSVCVCMVLAMATVCELGLKITYNGVST